jgi:REase_DpnII-MboI
MSTVIEILLQDAADALRSRVMSVSELSPSDRAFVAWALHDDSPRDDLAALATTAATNFSTTRSYHDLATIGYAAHASSLDEVQAQALRHGLKWLRGRSSEIAGEPAPFFTDAVALLGLALGGRFLQGDEVVAMSQWMLGFVPRAANLPAVKAWQRCLFSAALHALGSTEIPLPQDSSVADIRTALRACSVVPGEAGREEAEADERLTLGLLKQPITEDLPVVRAALRLAAFSWIRRSAPVIVPGRITVPDVLQLLDRVPAGLRRWTWEEKARTKGGAARKWHVDHEYHVQNLLYFLLAPVFPDLKDEEYFPSLGQKQPRTDLFIPSMKLIIELKFLRQTDQVTKIIDEVGSDASLYLAAGTDYLGIIAFVWDASQRVEEHALLQEGLRRIRGVLGAVVVSRPGMMS